MSLAFREDIEAGIINLESVNCVEPWDGMRLPYQRSGTGYLVFLEPESRQSDQCLVVGSFQHSYGLD